MTSSRVEVTRSSKAYIGLDFGSSNTSIATVSAQEIAQFRIDVKDKGWRELGDLREILPLPVAAPLALYIAEGGDASKRTKRARQTMEAALSLLIGVAICEKERIGRKERKQGPLCAFQKDKVSAGPLWKVLREYIGQINKLSTFGRPMNKLTVEPMIGLIDAAVTSIGHCKHDKIDETLVEWNRPLAAICNVIREVFESVEFGYFQNPNRKAGRIQSSFCRLHGPGFGDSGKQFDLEDTPDDYQPYLYAREHAEFLPLFPWILLENGHVSEKRLPLFFDSAEKDGSFSYRAPASPGEKKLKEIDDLAAYEGFAAELLQGKVTALAIRVRATT